MTTERSFRWLREWQAEQCWEEQERHRQEEERRRRQQEKRRQVEEWARCWRERGHVETPASPGATGRPEEWAQWWDDIALVERAELGGRIPHGRNTWQEQPGR